MSDPSNNNNQPLTLAESIRRKIAEAQAAAAKSSSSEGKTESSNKNAVMPLRSHDNTGFQTSRNELKVGSMCGAYALDKLIHTGGFARIFEAEHELLSRRVAIKVLTKERVGKPYTVKRMQEEARALCALRNQHVIEVHDFGIHRAGHPFIILELVQAPTLKELLDSSGQPPAPITMQIIEQLAPPFLEKSLTDYKNAHSTRMPQKPEALSDQMFNVFTQALDKVQGRRHGSVQEFVVAVENALRGGYWRLLFFLDQLNALPYIAGVGGRRLN